MASPSSLPVSTRSDFLPITMAVPVSWHIGNTPPAEMLRFLSRSRATNRSLPEASGSSMIVRNWARWPGRREWLMSWNASEVSLRIAPGSTLRNVSPSTSTVLTPSVDTSR